MAITTEDIRNYKETLLSMEGRRMNANAMYLITMETIYKVTIEVATKAIKTLKKVIRRGPCKYKAGSKTDVLLLSYKKVFQEYNEMCLKMDMKQMPNKADFLIECWLKKDAAEKAAKEYKEKKALRKSTRAAASLVKNLNVNDTYCKTQKPETSANVIIEVIV
ncbi:hypothetical protein CAEBREN_02381 [Caenorhabditis brenneri]|uniref:Uncharacterized protein n=1 Tax=Caenorhabditis brenneri TaxID=135651 RepID=G0MQV6_CAEBE|nr:hypothetical protein CAEBREN_02381 [Caenorhabditis brenneri]